jgi:hypothetical protein
MIYHIIFNKNLNILVHKYNCLIEESLKIPRRYSEAGISKDKRDIGPSKTKYGKTDNRRLANRNTTNYGVGGVWKGGSFLLH